MDSSPVKMEMGPVDVLRIGPVDEGPREIKSGGGTRRLCYQGKVHPHGLGPSNARVQPGRPTIMDRSQSTVSSGVYTPRILH